MRIQRALASVKRNLYSVKIRAYKAPMTRKPTIGRPSHPAQARGKMAKALRKRKPVEQTPYHHGALHEALLKAAQTVLERDGLQGLTLRAVARDAGVSHA